MMIRRKIATAALLTSGALALVLTAGCQSSQNASGAGASPTPTPSTTTPSMSIPMPPASGGAPAMRPSATPECKAADLTLTVGQSTAATGHVYQALVFTNKSGAPCVLQGFPGVSYVTGDNGTEVGPPAVRDGNKGPQLTLAQGKVASAIVDMTDVAVFDANTCHPTPVRGFRVYAPDDTAAMFVSRPTMGCAITPPTPQLRVQTIKPGPGGV